MLKHTMAAVVLMLMATQQTAMSKDFKANDNSQNSNCTYVHNWFQKTKDKHAVFVTTGGYSFEQGFGKGGRCQAGGATTLAAAIAYAIRTCEANGRKHGDHRACKVVESR